MYVSNDLSLKKKAFFSSTYFKIILKLSLNISSKFFMLIILFWHSIKIFSSSFILRGPLSAKQDNWLYVKLAFSESGVLVK